MSSHDTQLQAEAEFLFRKIFGLAPAAELGGRYLHAHTQLNLQDSPATSTLLSRIIARDLDVEAIEYVLRLRDKRNALTRKIRILHYLAECDPRTFAAFYPEATSNTGAKASMYLLPFRCAYCYLLGRFLLWRYRLA